jgi:O-antigen ligase
VFSPAIHRYIFLFGIFTLGGAIVWGEFPTSIPQIILSANWLLEGGFAQKWERIRRNQIFWVLMSLFALHVLGLINTQDLKNGGDDIGVKFPLLLIPFLFFTTEKPLDKSELKGLMYTVIAGILSSSLWCLFYYFDHPNIEAREASRFISHIRFGLVINMGICILIYLISQERITKNKFIYGTIILYLVFFMVKISLITGLMMFAIIITVLALFNIVKQPARVKLASLLVLAGIAITGLLFLKSEWDASKYVDPSANNTVKKMSASGREYYPPAKTHHTENGFYVDYNIQYLELAQQWERRSKTHVYQEVAKGNSLAWVLVRYLASKGLTKDSVGINQLTSEDVTNIERGITNYKYANASALRKRIKEFLWEYEDYKQGANPSGNTSLMRLEFWKAAIYIIERNLWMGVGTGDAKLAFNKAYVRTETKLAYEWRLRSHNQFLAITVCFGICGLIVFVFFLFYPAFQLRKYLHPLYFLFFIIAFVSFLTEDTLETQAGVTFFTYYNTLFLWLAYREKTDKLKNDSRDSSL